MADANSWALLVGSVTGLTSLAGVAYTAWNARKQSADERWAGYFGKQGERILTLEKRCEVYQESLRAANLEIATLRGDAIVKDGRIRDLTKKVHSTQSKLDRMSKFTTPDIQAAWAAMDSEPEDIDD